MHVHPDFVLRKVYGRSLLMPIRNNDACNDPIFLNGVASVIWELAQEGMSRTDLIEKVKNLYRLEEHSMELLAVKNFLQELINSHLIFD